MKSVKMAKKTKIKKDKAKKDVPEDGAAPKKSGLFGKMALGVALGAASFGTVLFIPGGSVPEASMSEAHAVAEAKAESLDLEVETSFVELTPFTISLDGGNSLLKIGITLEASEDASYDIDPDNPQMRDTFTGYLRALKPDQIRDAAYMARLRAQLLQRARLVFGADSVHGVLITDFLVQ